MRKPEISQEQLTENRAKLKKILDKFGFFNSRVVSELVTDISFPAGLVKFTIPVENELISYIFDRKTGKLLTPAEAALIESKTIRDKNTAVVIGIQARNKI